MAISKDLFLALLSMDSYNRGYGAGISDAGPNDLDGLGETKNVSKIGNAIVSYTLANVSEEFATEAEAAGFYAVAYEVPAGAWEDLTEDTVVISYRGTDADSGKWCDSPSHWMTTRQHKSAHSAARGL